MSATQEELKLIRAAKDGNREAFAALYEQNVQKVYGYIYARVNDSQVAEDITADVFVRAIEIMERYERGDVPFLGWLYHIAHGQVIDYFRRQSRQQPAAALEDVTLVASDNPERAVARNLRNEQLLAHIQDLTEDQQQVIMLRFLQGYSLKETATLMGKKVGAVKALQFRALRVLSQKYEVVIEEEEM